MHTRNRLWTLCFWLFICLGHSVTLVGAEPDFAIQEIDASLQIGYAVIIEDIDRDGSPDLVIVDKHQVAWYANPGRRGDPWSKHVILDGQTRPDNVCIVAVDIVGDGLPELVLGAGWRPFDTLNAGQLVWLRRGSDPRQPWTAYELPCEQPMVHRIGAIDLDGDGRQEIVHVPLIGRGATKQGNWVDGRPVAVVSLKIPSQHPEKTESWKPAILSQQLHVAHNFTQGPAGGFARPGNSLLVASYDGLSLVYPEGTADNWTTTIVHPANQENPASSRGASEVEQSKDSLGWIATIEPWHGNQVVVYVPGKPDPEKPFSFDRHVIDDHLRWGHAVSWADLDGDGRDELIIGVRDDPAPDRGDTFSERRGVRIYRPIDETGRGWQRTLLDEGGVAVEDLSAADLDGDGRVDIVAVGRQTRNVKIYWNVEQ
jgi:hypothetical protein